MQCSKFNAIKWNKFNIYTNAIKRNKFNMYINDDKEEVPIIRTSYKDVFPPVLPPLGDIVLYNIPR